MNWLGTQLNLVDVAQSAIEFALNWLLQSSLLLGVGLAMGRLLKPRGSAVQSVIYRTTIVAVLICPLATWGLSQAGVSGWSVELPGEFGRQRVQSKIAQIDEPAPVTAVEAADPVFVPANPTTEFPLNANERFAESLPTNDSLPFALDVEQTIAAPSVDVSSAADEAYGSSPPSFSVSFLGFVTLGVTAFWLLVSFALAARLASAWRQLAGLRSRAARADEGTIRTCQQLASSLSVITPDVLRSPCLPSPCLAGLRRPAVLLPEDDHSLSIREVLIHELAHLRRHDCHWNLLRQIATAMFFFQPLLWKLSRRLEVTAEEVCDDYVVQLGGDRQEYAHRLVDIAELSSAPIAAAGVGIVSFRSMLAKRVSRIMDTSRTLSTRAGNVLLSLVLVGGLVGTAFTGLVGLSPRATQAEAEAETTTIAESSTLDTESEDEANADITEDDDLITIQGTVVDPNGQPLSGATIHIARWYWDPDVPREPLSTATSGASGQFDISYRKSQFKADLQRPDMWKEVTIVASANSFGPAWVERDELKPNEKPTLRLVEDDVFIKAQIVDLEGKPLSGVTVRVGGLAASTDENLDAWLNALRQGEILWEASNRYLGKYTPYNPKGIPDTIVTDGDGSFEFQGVGKERRLRVSLEGPTIAYTEATLVTRNMKPLVANDGMPDPEWARKHTVYGANCQIAVHPTQPIHGIVKDATTGQPLSGVAVESYRMTQRGISARRLIRVTSDDQGRFKLIGMPKGRGKQIIAVPKDDQPYLMREFDVPDQLGLEPIELDLELHRGAWVSGRVTEKETGEPVPARVYYLPYRTNSFAEVLPEFDEHGNVDGYQKRYVTDSEGRFRIVGLPGPAIIGVECVTKRFPRGMGHEVIDGLDEHGHFQTYNNPLQPGKLWPTAMKRVDISEDEEEVQLDFQLDIGRSVTLTTVDQQGREIADLNVAGIEGREHWKSVELATFDMVALAPGEKRTLLFHQEEQRLGKAMQFVATDNAPQSLKVQLEPCITIRGQLVDDNQQPISGARIRISPKPGGDFSPELKPIATDAEGRFEHSGVLPGTNYNVMSESTEVGFKTLTEDLEVNPGETIDLGTIDVTSDERPNPERVEKGISMPENKAGIEAKHGAPFHYAGQVVDATGKPVLDAKIHLVYWYSHQDNSPNGQPLATTGADGRFEFEMAKSDFRQTGDSVPPWLWGSLVAVSKGRGLVWGSSVAFETTGAALRESKERAKRQGTSTAELEKRLAAERGPLKFSDRNMPIDGRVVDIEGKTVAGARVKIISLRTGADGTLDAWHEAVRRRGIKFFEANRELRKHLYGPFVEAILPQAETNSLTFKSSAARPYLANQTHVDTRGNEAEPVSLDIKLTPAGGILTGRVVDAETGKGVSGHIIYLASAAQPNALAMGAGMPSARDGIRSDIEGRFRLVVPSGPAHIAFKAFDDGYQKTAARPQGSQEVSGTVFMSITTGEHPLEYHALTKIDVGDEGKQQQIELQVTRSAIITGQVLDAEGQPVSTGFYTGRQDLIHDSWRPLDDGKFHLLNVDPKRPRQAVFVDPQRNLAGELLVKAKPTGPLTVRLQPAATISGQVVDEDGAPLNNVTLFSGSVESMMQPAAQPTVAANSKRAKLPLPPALDSWWSQLRQHQTDAEGRFTIQGFLPNRQYQISGHREPDDASNSF